MKQQLLQWAERYEALTLRERVIVALLVLIAVVVIWYEAILAPMANKHKSIESKINTAQTQLDANYKQIAALKSGALQDPDEENKQRINNLKQQVAELAQKLAEKMHGLIEPAQMA